VPIRYGFPGTGYYRAHPDVPGELRRAAEAAHLPLDLRVPGERLSW